MAALTGLAPNPTQVVHHAEQARWCEEEAAAHPTDNEDFLLEAAHSWHLAGDSERALELLAELAARSGEDAEFAAVATAEVLFDLGRDDEACAQLDRALRAGPGSAPCHMGAELLESRGDLIGAQRWFSVAATHLSEDEIARLDGPAGWMAPAALLVRGRARVRAALGLPPDELDLRVPSLPAAGLPLGPRSSELLGRDEVLASPDHAGAAIRMLVWQRSDRADAVARFGSAFAADGPPGTDPELAEVQHLRELEQDLRRLSARGAPRISLVLGTADSLAAFIDAVGGHAEDPGTRGAYLDQRYREGAFLAWPPPRNGPCWCGSAAKYKKCCGRPGT